MKEIRRMKKKNRPFRENELKLTVGPFSGEFDFYLPRLRLNLARGEYLIIFYYFHLDDSAK